MMEKEIDNVPSSVEEESEVGEEIVVIQTTSVTEPRHEKTNVLVSDLVRLKPGCTATEDG